MTLLIVSKDVFNASPEEPRLFNAIPNSRENTIICSIFPSAIAATGFVGKILIRTSFKEGASVD